MLHATAPTRPQKIVEHLPNIPVRGTKKSGPNARPATAAEIYTKYVQPSVADMVPSINKK